MSEFLSRQIETAIDTTLKAGAPGISPLMRRALVRSAMTKLAPTLESIACPANIPADAPDVSATEMRRKSAAAIGEARQSPLGRHPLMAPRPNE